MTRDELNAKYCMDVVSEGEKPVIEYEVTFTLKGGQPQKAYAVAREGHWLGAVNHVKYDQIPKNYQKYFAHSSAKPVKKLYNHATEAPKNWDRLLNKDRRIKNLVLPKDV